MQLFEIRRLLSKLIPRGLLSQAQAQDASRGESDRGTPSALEVDPMWHGDHWQNLLSSPMDARRYVMEDWSATTATEWWNADHAASAH
ncbi:hypothetical protein [Paraburkholderia dilworthii]|uniref:hypothetical protein n=1 Tax=Paraburkholderia dilworthii TaxID=948106 RepID=UPI00041454CD|nr:hypothetical protein [Paraburkholderia dilworthii]